MTITHAPIAIALAAIALIVCGLAIIFTGDNERNAAQVCFGALVALCGLFLVAIAMIHL
jgi:drug/metabolite transporter (DMT)-like permease